VRPPIRPDVGTDHPQRVHTIRAQTERTDISSGSQSALILAL
jgi:hypothetical protein